MGDCEPHRLDTLTQDSASGVRRVFHRTGLVLSPVVERIDIRNVSSREAKDDAPVSANRYSPETLALAFQRMQAKAWQAHVPRRTCGVKPRKNIAQLRNVFSKQAAKVTSLVEPLESLVADRVT